MAATKPGAMKNSKLINQLNRQFNRNVRALLRYMVEAASTKGAEQETVRQVYLQEVGEKVEHAQSLADQIVALGGIPILKPVPDCPPTTVREMLSRDAAEEHTDEQNCLRLAAEAEQAKLVELQQKLEQQAAANHEHRYEMQCLLW